MAFPLFVLAMGIVAAMGNTVENIIYATAIINLPFYARVARAETSVRRQAGYVHAARLCGSGNVRILATQIFPNILPPMMVQVSLNMGWAIKIRRKRMAVMFSPDVENIMNMRCNIKVFRQDPNNPSDILFSNQNEIANMAMSVISDISQLGNEMEMVEARDELQRYGVDSTFTNIKLTT